MTFFAVRRILHTVDYTSNPVVEAISVVVCEAHH